MPLFPKEQEFRDKLPKLIQSAVAALEDFKKASVEEKIANGENMPFQPAIDALHDLQVFLEKEEDVTIKQNGYAPNKTSLGRLDALTTTLMRGASKLTLADDNQREIIHTRYKDIGDTVGHILDQFQTKHKTYDPHLEVNQKKHLKASLDGGKGSAGSWVALDPSLLHDDFKGEKARSPRSKKDNPPSGGQGAGSTGPSL